MPQLAPLGQLVTTHIIAAFYGSLVLLWTLWELVRYGPQNYLYAKNRSTRPAVLDDPELGTHCYARMKNIRLHYVEKGPKDAPLMVFLHGFPEFWYTWRYQLKEFGTDFRAVALDMRGYGESEKPQSVAEYHIPILCADVKQFIEHLGYKKCYLVSHDWGGGVAMDFAARYPSMVEKLVVCNSAHGVALKKHMQSSLKQFLSSWYMFFFQLPWFPEFFMGLRDFILLKDMFTSMKDGIRPKYLSQDDLEAYIYTFKDMADREGPINYYRAAMRYKRDRTPSVRIKVPTLIVWGARDRHMDKVLANKSKAYVDNECRITQIVSATHWVQQDEPHLVNEAIRNFIP